MLHRWCNMQYSDNDLGRSSLEELRKRLPPGWKLEEETSKSGKQDFLCFTSPDGRQGKVKRLTRQNVDPRSVLELIGRFPSGNRPLVASRYLSKNTREKLRAAGFSYTDLTGSIYLVLENPGIFMESTGADKDPSREKRPARSLKGPKAGCVVRSLCDFREPVGVRELALRAGVDPGYVSRLLVLLYQEAIIERQTATSSVSRSKSGSRTGSVSRSRSGSRSSIGPGGRKGGVTKVFWDRLIRRWAEDAPLSTRGPSATYIDPRGLPELLARLASKAGNYAITSSFAAAKIAPIAPPRLITIYVEDLARDAEDLGLRPAEAGANALLIESSSDVVFLRTQRIQGLKFVAVSQAAADLFTSPGRGPAEAEELLRWMAAHEGDWRE